MENEVKKVEKTNEEYINEIVKTQMDQFQNQFMEEFQNELSTKIKEFEDNKKEFENDKQKHVVKELLFKMGLETELLDYVYDDDMEIVNFKIEELNKIIDKRVNDLIMLRLKDSYIPPNNEDSIKTDKKFDKPSYMV